MSQYIVQDQQEIELIVNNLVKREPIHERIRKAIFIEYSMND
jgi:hypothetical protein